MLRGGCLFRRHRVLRRRILLFVVLLLDCALRFRCFLGVVAPGLYPRHQRRPRRPQLIIFFLSFLLSEQQQPAPHPQARLDLQPLRRPQGLPGQPFSLGERLRLHPLPPLRRRPQGQGQSENLSRAGRAGLSDGEQGGECDAAPGGCCCRGGGAAQVEPGELMNSNIIVDFFGVGGNVLSCRKERERERETRGEAKGFVKRKSFHWVFLLQRQGEQKKKKNSQKHF